MAIGVTCGLGGLIEPLIIFRHTSAGKHFPLRAHLAMILCLLLAIGVGYEIMQFYGLH